VERLRKRDALLLRFRYDVYLQENELWDKESNHSIGSWVPPQKLKNEGYAESRTSVYGRETYYEPAHTRSFSPSLSQAGNMYAPPPGYQSGRNTPTGFTNPQMRPMSDADMPYQPTPSRPVTNYLDMPIPTTRSPEDNGYGSPSNAEIDRAVEEILRDADLNSITKREIRRRLEDIFGVDLTPRKSSVNAAIDRVLLSKA
jgi:chitin synthase